MGLLDRILGRTAPDRGLGQVPEPTDAPMLVRPLRKAPRERTYLVKQGDTLASIARDVYGDERACTRIADANSERIGEPPVLYPGLELELP